MMTEREADANAANRATDGTASDIVAFWFGEGEVHGKRREQWFKKNVVFDDEIRHRFLAKFELAAAGKLTHWKNHPHSCLALIIALDQFPRNLFRGSPRAFATDALAREATAHALANGVDRALKPVERQFIYLPLEHSESLPDQQHCLKLMQQLSAFAETADLHVWAEKHLAIIASFGRFPHRNAALGRESTAEEIEFLKQPGSGF